MVSQIFYSIISSKNTWFEVGSRSQIDTDELSEKEDRDIFDPYSTNKKLDEELSGQEF